MIETKTLISGISIIYEGNRYTFEIFKHDDNKTLLWMAYDVNSDLEIGKVTNIMCNNATLKLPLGYTFVVYNSYERYNSITCQQVLQPISVSVKIEKRIV